jgi:hypothetical protein
MDGVSGYEGVTWCMLLLVCDMDGACGYEGVTRCMWGGGTMILEQSVGLLLAH